MKCTVLGCMDESGLSLEVVAAVNDDSILKCNLMRSPLLKERGVPLHVQSGFVCASLAYNDALLRCQADVVVFAHQDVYLPAGWEERLFKSIALIERYDQDWAVLGVYGVTDQGKHIGHVWSSGLQSMVGESFNEPVPVVSVDEVLIVIRRASGLLFDSSLPGFHLYGTDIVQAAISLGKKAYVVHAPLVHNSRPILYLGEDYFAAYKYLVRKWSRRLPIPNNVMVIMRPRLFYAWKRLRQKMNEYRYRNIPRRNFDRQLDCVGLAHRLGFE